MKDHFRPFRGIPSLPAFFLAVVCLGSWLPARAAEPANKKANPTTRTVLDYFHKLQEQKEGRRIISGQFGDFSQGSSLRILNDVFQKTAHWPGIIGADYADFAHGGIAFANPNKAAIEYWRQGGLVTISAHMYNPANPAGGGLRDKGVDLNDLLKEGTDTHARWMKQLDRIADGLLELKQAGVVVLWRPFHEVNGDWFWWGDKDPETFIKVWRQMFEYYSNNKGLDNLIWVYSPNHGNNTAKFYAGDAYVDLVGLDAYTDFIDPQHIRGSAAVLALKKPFGFTEFGPSGPHDPPGDYDYLRFIDGLNKEFPQTCFFMSWNGKWSLASNVHTKELLDHPSIINRENLPKFSTPAL